MEDQQSFVASTGSRAEGATEEHEIWFTKTTVVEFIRGLDPTVRTEVASRAFKVLVLNAADLGLVVRCGFASCHGRFCPAPHWIRAIEFLALPPETMLAARGCGGSLGAILATYQTHLAVGT